MDIPLQDIKPTYPGPDHEAAEKQSIQFVIDKLGLQVHPEGGYFVETDYHPLRIPNPYQSQAEKEAGIESTRAASTTIYYYLTPREPMGAFHSNKSRTVHTWHRGRGRYVLLHLAEGDPDQSITANKPRVSIETFVVGPNLERGERMQWIVPGGNHYKASFLLPDSPEDDGYGPNDGQNGATSTEGLLISEVRMRNPGFCG